MKRILKFIGCLALAFAGAGAYGATVPVTDQAGLDNALSNAKSGDVIQITQAGEYELNGLGGAGYTLEATVAGVTLQRKKYTTSQPENYVSSCTGLVTLKNLAWDMTVNAYYPHFKNIHAVDCTFTGLLFAEETCIFEHCTFNAIGTEYNLWCYHGPVTFTDCTFNGAGKFLHLYNESNYVGDQLWKVTVDGCTFNSSKKGKAAVNVKARCNGSAMRYDLVVKNCKIAEGGDNFPEASTSDTLIVFNKFIQLDQISASVPNVITITQDGKVLYADNAIVSAPSVQVEVEENSGMGITPVVVQEIVTNPEIEKVEQKAIAEAIKADVEGKDAAFVKVKLEKVETEANKTTLQFVVAPYIGAVQVDNANIKGAVPFRLPLLKEKFVEYAKITHAGDPDRFVLVKKGANGEPYVDVALTHFSTVLASVATEADMVPEGAVKIQDGLWGDKNTLGEAEIVYIVGKTGLEAFRDWVNGKTGTVDSRVGAGKTFVLVADVDLQGSESDLWTPIGEHDNNMFVGTFDGNGKSIQNLFVKTKYAGLFAQLTGSGCIKNLTIASGKIVMDGQNGAAGAITAYLTGGRLENVTNYVDVVTDGTYGRIGGFVGVQADEHSTRSYIVKGANYGTIAPDSSISLAGGYTGGILAQSQFLLTLEDCVNFGTVKGGAKGASGVQGIGGIIGNFKPEKSSSATENWPLEMVRCINYGSVAGSPYAVNIGGLIGKHDEHPEINPKRSVNGFVLTDCANYGEVTGEATWKREVIASICSYRCGWGVVGTLTVRSGAYAAGLSSSANSNWTNITVYASGVAQDINGNDIDVEIYYTSIADAIAAAKEGDTVKLFSASSENFTLPAGVTFDATGAAYTGTISAPEGYFVKEVSTKVYECKPAVAQIGTTIYSSFKEAYDATVDGDTITILADFALKEAFKLGSVDRNNLIIDLNGKTMTLNSVVSTQYKNLTFKNGAIDIGVPAGGQAGEHAWDKLFYVESCELKFLNVTLTYTNGVSTVGIQTGGAAKLAFKDSMLNFANCDKPVYLGTPGDCVFDHTVISADKATTYVVHGDNNCGPVIFKGGSSVTMKDCGGLNSNSTFEMSDTTVNATGLKNPLFRNSSVTLVSNAKIFVDGATNMFGYNAWELVVNAGCTFDVRNCGYTGAIFNRGGSVFKSGSTVVISNCCVTENTTHACYGKDNAIRAYGDLTIEDGADVRLYGTIDAFSGPGTITIADGRYTKLVQREATEKFDLKGGIYTVEPDDAFVNEAYEKVANEDPNTKDAYPTRVQAKPSVASYETEDGVVNTYLLEKAVQLVKAGGKVTLLAPNAESFTTTRTEPFTLVTSEGKAFTGKITMPNGYALKDNGNGTYSYYKMPIATITREGVTTKYDSLPAACAAAQNGDTIALSPMIIDATDTYVIKDLTFKKVTLKGAGRDKTVLDWGNGYKLGTDGAGTDSNNHLSADLTFENLALTITHADGMPYDEWMKHPNSVTFRNATINGQYVAIDPTLFDNCNFTGPVNGYDEYLIWVYGSETVVSNCTFEKSGSHACIKLYNDSGYMCSAKVLGTTSFAKIGDEGGVITVSHSLIKAADSDFAYDLQIDTDAVTIPDGAKFVGHDPGEWGAQGITVVNGTKKNDKYVSGAVFSDRGTDKQICDIAAKVVGPDSVCLAYVGPATVLGNFRWYIGDKQVEPKTGGAEVEGLPENPSTEVKQQVAADTNNVIKTLSGDDITKFADTDVAGSSFNPNGTPKDEVKQALVKAASEQAVKDAIAAQLGESNSNERVEIKLDKFEFEVEDQSATLSVVEYDVKPWIKVTTIVGNVETVTEAVIPNEALEGHPLTFRLAVNDNFGQYAKVIHTEGTTTNETYLTKVFTGATGKYVQLKSDHFSNFFISANVTEPKCKVGDQFYNSVPEAIAANVGVPDAVFTLMAPCGDEGLALLEGQTIDLNGQAFTGSIAPVDGYHEQVTYDDKVFNAYKPQLIELSTGDKLPVRVAPAVFVTWKDGSGTFVKGDNGMEKWKNDVLGVDGSVAANKIVPMMVKAAEGSSVVTIKTPIAAFEPLRKSGVKVQYSLLKRNGGGEFVRYGESKDTPVFTVDVSAIETQTFWKIQVSYEKEY